MQIDRLSQCFSRRKAVKIGKKRSGIKLTHLITIDYELCSFLVYLLSTSPLDVYTRVMRGSL